jgi:hypothetical protein
MSEAVPHRKLRLVANRGRQAHETPWTVGDAHRDFGEAIALLGMSYAEPQIDQAVHNLVFEGRPFGERPALLRRPGSKFYEKTYLEALSVARAIVTIGLNAGAVNVLRAAPPAPDVIVDYGDRQLYVEHAMILDEDASAVDVAIEQADFAVYEALSADSSLRDLIAAGILQVRLEHVDVAVGVDARALVAETVAIARTVTADVVRLSPDPLVYPALAANGARISYKVCASPTGSVFQHDFLDRWTEFEPTLRRVLTQKRAAVKGYDSRCKPVWLLLSASMGFEMMPGVLNVAKTTIAELGLGDFERVILQVPRQPPFVVGPTPATRPRGM